jgi:hypothetical protein
MGQTDFNPGQVANVGVTGWMDTQLEEFQGKTVGRRQPGALSLSEKQKEKVLIFLTTAVLLLFLASAASGSTVITPSGAPGRNASNPFDYTNITVTSNSATISPQSDIRDMFGGSFSTVEAPGRVLFADQPGQNATYQVTFTTHSPLTLAGYSLTLFEDMVGSPNRSATSFELLANGHVISNVAIMSPGQNYSVKFGSDAIKVSDSFAPISATTFQVIFTGNLGYSGIRVLGFQGVAGSPGGQDLSPEPSTISLALLAGLAFAAFYRRRIAH